MPSQDQPEELRWSTIHASAFTQTHGLLRWTRGTQRPHGAFRYRCPLTGSYVLVTDEPTLTRLDHSPARIRCADCGEQHLVTVELDGMAGPAGIATPAGKP